MSSPDPIRIQVDVKTKVPKGVKLGKKAIRQAIERWALTGHESRFVEIRAVHWINPVRKNKALAVWKVALAEDVTPEEYKRIEIPDEKISGDTPEEARRSLRLDSMPTRAFSASLTVKDQQPAAKRRKAGSSKNAPRKKRKVSKVRNRKGTRKRK